MSTRVPVLSSPPAVTRLRRVLQAGLDQRAASKPSHETQIVNIETHTINHENSLVWKHDRAAEQKLKALTTSVQRTAPLSTQSVLGRLHKLGLEIEMKRKEPPCTDPAAAAGDLDVDYQRMQSYYVCAQVGNPVLYVVKGWFMGDNRIGFDIMQRAAGLGLNLKTNDFYTLCGSNVSFDKSLEWYGNMFEHINAYAKSKNTGHLLPLPTTMVTHLTKQGNVGLDGFITEFTRLFDIETNREHKLELQGQLGKYKYDDLRHGRLSSMVKHQVQSEADSMVFFTGPHMVAKDKVTRLAIFVHSLSENTARDVLLRHTDYTEKVKAMQIPPNAQGKTRSPLVDKYLKIKAEAGGGHWGWTREDNPSLPEEMRKSLLIDESSIDNAPPVAPREDCVVAHMRAEILENSCYVARNVLGSNASFTAAHFEQEILKCLATVLDEALKEQEQLRENLRTWVENEYPGGLAALLAHPKTVAFTIKVDGDVNIEDYKSKVATIAKVVKQNVTAEREETSLSTFIKSDAVQDGNMLWNLQHALEFRNDELGVNISEVTAWPTSTDTPARLQTHEQLLRTKLGRYFINADVLMDKKLKDYAQNVLLRGVRRPNSVSWARLNGSEFLWEADPETGNKKVLRTEEEALAELEQAPNMTPVADGPLARFEGKMTNEKDLWQLVRNISGTAESVKLRYELFTKGEIAHPHIGAWVSAQKPWCPPLANPVGSWQNVYQVLVLGMFDSHYMPSHVRVRHALKPIIEQMWHATSRKPFKHVLFAPERFNLRQLPNGGAPLQWHIDQDAIAPACGMAPEANLDSMKYDAQDKAGAFLADTSNLYDSDFDEVPLSKWKTLIEQLKLKKKMGA